MLSPLDTPFEYRVLEMLGRRPGDYLSEADLTAASGGADDLEYALAALRRLGYDIEVHPAHGICLRSSADVIDRAEVQGALGTESFGRTLACCLEVGSTNDLGMRAAAEGAPHGTAILTEHQRTGRGRLGRTWYSPPGTGLWLSCVLRFELPAHEAWLLTLGAGVAVADAVRDTTGFAPDLKWPNDVRFAGRKLAGILTETRAEGDALAFAVVGIGINVNQDAVDFPDDLRETATSMKVAAGRSWKRSTLLASLLQALESVYTDLDSDRIRNLWKARSTMLGRRVRVAYRGAAVEGVAEDLAPDGALCIRLSGGVRRVFHAGDVEWVR